MVPCDQANALQCLPFLPCTLVSALALLYREIQSELHSFDSIIPVLDDEESQSTMLPRAQLVFALGNAKPNQYTCIVRQVCLNAAIQVFTVTLTSIHHGS